MATAKTNPKSPLFDPDLLKFSGLKIRLDGDRMELYFSPFYRLTYIKQISHWDVNVNVYAERDRRENSADPCWVTTPLAVNLNVTDEVRRFCAAACAVEREARDRRFDTNMKAEMDSVGGLLAEARNRGGT